MLLTVNRATTMLLSPLLDLFPRGHHRWVMGLRRAESLTEYFADQDPTGAVRQQRAAWFAQHPELYFAAQIDPGDPLCATVCQEMQTLARETGRDVAPIAVADVSGSQSPSDSTISHPLPSHALQSYAALWEPDLVWMAPDAAGRYRLIAGCVCFPSSWAVTEKLGLTMADIHAPVPGLNAALERQIDTFLTQLRPQEIWRRDNWNLASDDELNHHPSRPQIPWATEFQPSQVTIRFEHQLLLRLPRSGVILFGIRIALLPLPELLKFPPACERWATLIETMSPAAAAYKNLLPIRAPLLDCLRTPMEQDRD